MAAISHELVRWPELIRPATTYAGLMAGLTAITFAILGVSALWMLNTVTAYQVATHTPCQHVAQALSERQAELGGGVRAQWSDDDPSTMQCGFTVTMPAPWRTPRRHAEAEQEQLLDVMRAHGHIMHIRSATTTRDLWLLPYGALLLAMVIMASIGSRLLRSNDSPVARLTPWVSAQITGLFVLWVMLAWPLWMLLDWGLTDQALDHERSAHWPHLWWLPWVWFVLMTPVLEEWFFRAVIYRHFLQRDFRYLGMAISTGGFMVFHWPALAMIGSGSSPGAHLSLLMVSVLCCELYRRAGLWAAVQFHMLHNLAMVSLAWHAASFA
jgi:membrane protease YdiL (CAAX protease family)